MNDAVALLLVQRLFPEWVITRDAYGNWRAAFRPVISTGCWRCSPPPIRTRRGGRSAC